MASLRVLSCLEVINVPARVRYVLHVFMMRVQVKRATTASCEEKHLAARVDMLLRSRGTLLECQDMLNDSARIRPKYFDAISDFSLL